MDDPHWSLFQLFLGNNIRKNNRNDKETSSVVTLCWSSKRPVGRSRIYVYITFAFKISAEIRHRPVPGKSAPAEPCSLELPVGSML